MLMCFCIQSMAGSAYTRALLYCFISKMVVNDVTCNQSKGWSGLTSKRFYFRFLFSHDYRSHVTIPTHTHVALSPSLNTRTATDNNMAVASGE